MSSSLHEPPALENKIIDALKNWRLLSIRQCAKHPVFSSLTFSGVTAAVGITASVLIMHLQLHDDIQRTHQDAIKTETEVWSEVLNTFNQLRSTTFVQCGQAEITELHRLLEQSRYVRNIYVDVDPGTSQCATSAKGNAQNAEKPVVTAINISDMKFDVVQGLIPTTMKNTWTLNRIHQGNLTVDVVKNIIPTRNFTKQATVYKSTTPMPIALNGEMIKDYTLNPRLELMAKNRTIHHGYSWATSSYMWVDPLKVSGITVVTGMTLHDAIAKYEQAVLSALLIVLALSATVYLWSRRWLTKYETIEHYVRLLIRPENLVCLYQPIVDLKTGSPVGCEVLVRFKVSQTTMLPSQALGFIFEQGLSWLLDQAVIRRAWREMHEHVYKAQSPIKLLFPLKVAINLFPDNIRYSLLTPVFNELKAKTPGYDRFWKVNLEIVEKQYTHNLADQISRLRNEGFLFSVDDFGTGFSNINQIRTVKPDFLKIDGAFISDLDVSDKDSSFVPEIIGIANAIEAMTIAEGVETKDQHLCLQALGVNCGQGYLYAKPMTITAFVDYLRKHPQAPTVQQAFIKPQPAEVKQMTEIKVKEVRPTVEEQLRQPVFQGWGMARRASSIAQNTTFDHRLIVEDSAFNTLNDDPIEEPSAQSNTAITEADKS